MVNDTVVVDEGSVLPSLVGVKESNAVGHKCHKTETIGGMKHAA